MSLHGSSVFTKLNQYILTETKNIHPMFLVDAVNESLLFAASFLEDDVLPKVTQALTHCPETHEIVRFVNWYHYSDLPCKLEYIVEDIEETASSLRLIVEEISGPNEFALLSKSLHKEWMKCRDVLACAAMKSLDGLFLHFVADVMELFGCTPESKLIRRVAGHTRVKKKAYAFLDDDYEDIVEISDDEE